jgi:hypothetical protein
VQAVDEQQVRDQLVVGELPGQRAVRERQHALQPGAVELEQRLHQLGRRVAGDRVAEPLDLIEEPVYARDPVPCVYVLQLRPLTSGRRTSASAPA